MKSTSKDVASMDAMPRSTKFHTREILKTLHKSVQRQEFLCINEIPEGINVSLGILRLDGKVRL